MNITIVGAGAMGSLFGAVLAESGQDVTLVDINDAHLAAIQADGLRVQTEAGERRVRQLRACRPEQADTPPDLLIVFTKTLHTTQALAGVRHLIGDATQVLSLQNGLGNVEKINAFVPIERLWVGVTTWPADLVGPGHVHSRGAGVVRLMSADMQNWPFLVDLVHALSAAGLQARADAAVWGAIWEKVAFNAAMNSICSVASCTVGQLGDHPEGRVLAHAVVDEVLAVAQAQGIEVNETEVRASVNHALDHHRDHKPSMLQDLLAGRPTEMDAINAAVLRYARLLKVATPLTQTLCTLVRLIESKTRPVP
jgi:2-dehydropantoate 2-reductase